MSRPSTREKLLDCAERLFAEHGLKGVSLRSINAEAGLSPAALHYHFGSKERLVGALLDRHMPRLMARRGELLDELARSPHPPGPRELLDALIRPPAELLADDADAGHRYLRLIYRLQADGDLLSLFPMQTRAGGVDRLLPMLAAGVPHIPTRILEVRLGLAIDIMLRSMALEAPHEARALEKHVTSLLDFLTGALQAPDTTPS